MDIITINGESPSHPGSTWWIQVIRGPGHLLNPTKDMCLDSVYVNLGAGSHGNLSGLWCRIWSGFHMKKCPAPQRHCLNGWIWPSKFWAFWEHLKKLLEVNWWSLDVIAMFWAISHCHGSYCILVALSSDYSKGTQWPKVIKMCFDFLVIEHLL